LDGENTNMKTQKSNQKSGFTLLELLAVIAIIVVVFGISFSALMQSQASQIYNNNFMKIVSMVNNARSQAITGKGQLDYTNFDNDNRYWNSTPPDFVTPANYGVRFDNTVATNNVIFFADINPPKSAPLGAKGRYDSGTNYGTGQDLILDSLTIPKTNILEVRDSTASPVFKSSIFYSPNYADISFEGLDTSANPIIKIRLSQPSIGLCRQIAIHKLAGIPEIGGCI
jgi:prepilin-type N-terminal cleavage/methylation domain-containing protein